MTKSKCEHKRWVYPEPFVEDGEWVFPDAYEVSTYEDIVLGQGRFKCTQCGEVGYYTGLWRKFWEQGIPCSGSEGIRRTDMAKVYKASESFVAKDGDTIQGWLCYPSYFPGEGDTEPGPTVLLDNPPLKNSGWAKCIKVECKVSEVWRRKT